MKIRNIRWGYDGGEITCGDIEGNTLVEICFTGNDRHNYFVVASRLFDYMRIVISPIPLFDVLIYMNTNDVDFDYEMSKCTTNIIEDYDYDIGDVPDEINKSEFFKAIKLVRFIMQYYYNLEDKSNNDNLVYEFIKQYIDKELDEIVLPEIKEDE